ncbi:MAG: transcription elongation factor GreA [bacterium]|nr:transcription elongation factor GreA [bacterium]
MPQYITKEGLKKLKDEVKHLKTVEMRRIVKLIAEAAAFGDLKENAGYHDARNAKSFLLGRIEQLENAINEAIVVEKQAGGAIQVGSQIKILFDGKEENYTITAPGESDILKNKLSYQSPLGQALMGKKEKEEFTYEINGKKIKVKILKIK